MVEGSSTDVPLNADASAGSNFEVVLIRKVGSLVETVFSTNRPVEKMVTILRSIKPVMVATTAIWPLPRAFHSETSCSGDR